MSVDSVPLISVISAAKEDRISWFKIGRLAERLMLEFNSIGLNTSIFVASIEMGLQKQLQEIVGSKFSPQFLFVIGKAQSLHKLTPRFSVEEKLWK